MAKAGLRLEILTLSAPRAASTALAWATEVIAILFLLSAPAYAASGIAEINTHKDYCPGLETPSCDSPTCHVSIRIKGAAAHLLLRSLSAKQAPDPDLKELGLTAYISADGLLS